MDLLVSADAHLQSPKSEKLRPLIHQSAWPFPCRPWHLQMTSLSTQVEIAVRVRQIIDVQVYGFWPLNINWPQRHMNLQTLIKLLQSYACHRDGGKAQVKAEILNLKSHFCLILTQAWHRLLDVATVHVRLHDHYCLNLLQSRCHPEDDMIQFCCRDCLVSHFTRKFPWQCIVQIHYQWYVCERQYKYTLKTLDPYIQIQFTNRNFAYQAICKVVLVTENHLWIDRAVSTCTVG